LKIIEIIVSPQGEVHVETKGFSGCGCREASALLERALGQRQSDELTAEFYQAQPVDALQQSQH
jgi:hypothetical protein